MHRQTPMVIVGPQASGKTLNASAFQVAFYCTSIVDNWTGKERLQDGALALTNNLNITQDDCPDYDVISIEVALRAIS